MTLRKLLFTLSRGFWARIEYIYLVPEFGQWWLSSHSLTSDQPSQPRAKPCNPTPRGCSILKSLKSKEACTFPTPQNRNTTSTFSCTLYDAACRRTDDFDIGSPRCSALISWGSPSRPQSSCWLRFGSSGSLICTRISAWYVLNTRTLAPSHLLIFCLQGTKRTIRSSKLGTNRRHYNRTTVRHIEWLRFDTIEDKETQRSSPNSLRLLWDRTLEAKLRILPQSRSPRWGRFPVRPQWRNECRKHNPQEAEHQIH